MEKLLIAMTWLAELHPRHVREFCLSQWEFHLESSLSENKKKPKLRTLGEDKYRRLSKSDDDRSDTDSQPPIMWITSDSNHRGRLLSRWNQIVNYEDFNVDRVVSGAAQVGFSGGVLAGNGEPIMYSARRFQSEARRETSLRS